MDRYGAIAGELRAIRARKGAPQSAVASAIGANRSTLSAWERMGCIGLADAWALADYYGVTLDELAGRAWNGRKEGR